MASKSRGGLSKRELAAQQKATKVKVSTRATASKSSSKGYSDPTLAAEMNPVGATQNPGLKGSTYQVKETGTLAPGQAKSSAIKSNSSSKSSSSKKDTRSLAAKAQQSKIIPGLSVGSLTGDDFGNTGDPMGVNKGTIRQGSSGLLDKLKSGAMTGIRNLSTLAGNYYQPISEVRGKGQEGLNSGAKFAYENSMLTPRAAASEGDISALGQYLQTSSQPDIPTGAGDNGEIFFNNNTRPGITRNDFSTPSTPSRNFNPFSIPTAQASEGIMMPEDLSDEQKSSRRNFNSGNYGVDPSLQEEMFRQQQNEEFSGGPAPSDLPARTVGNRSGRGSGMFATGKGLQGEDPYIQELRKAYSSNGGEKWLKKQFDELIKALDPTYEQMQREGTDALNAQLNNQNVQLASVMNANNVGDSEQRAQIMAGQQRDTQTALGNLLAKLSQNKAQDISGYRSEYTKQRGQLDERNQTNRQTLLDKIRAYQESQTKGLGGGGAKNPKDPYAASDKAFESDAKRLATLVRSGKISREDAVNEIRTFHPDYDENVIYDLVPDKF